MKQFLRDLDDTFEPLHVGRKTCLIVALTLPAPLPDKEKKLTYIFIFTLLCGASKGFMKAFKAFESFWNAQEEKG